MLKDQAHHKKDPVPLILEDKNRLGKLNQTKKKHRKIQTNLSVTEFHQLMLAHYQW